MSNPSEQPADQARRGDHGGRRPRPALPVAGPGDPRRRQREHRLVHGAGPAGRGGQVRPGLHRGQPVHHPGLPAALPQPAGADDAAVRARGGDQAHRPGRHHDHVLQRPVQPGPAARLAGADQRRPVRLERGDQRRRGRGGQLQPGRALRLRHALRPRPGVRPGRPGPVGLLRGGRVPAGPAGPEVPGPGPAARAEPPGGALPVSPARSTSPARRRGSRSSSRPATPSRAATWAPPSARASSPTRRPSSRARRSTPTSRPARPPRAATPITSS